MPRVRPAAVAGLFYPAGAAELERSLDRCFKDAGEVRSARPPKGLIVPHAGFIYSGPIAATAYASLKPIAEKIRRVVILGPAHRYPVRGLALPDAESFETPLGTLDVDPEAVKALSGLEQVKVSGEAHAEEHSLEVQLPFLQRLLRGFRIVPLVVGHAGPETVAEVVDRLWGGEETLFVVSSDLTHYLPYAVAQKIDRETIDEILKFDVPIDSERACGAAPINGFLTSAKKRGLHPTLLDLRNSGDTAGDRRQVVGYGAVAFEEATDG